MHGRDGRGRDPAGLLQQAQFALVIAAVEGIRLLGSAVPAGTLDVVAEQLYRMRVDLEVVISRAIRVCAGWPTSSISSSPVAWASSATGC